MKISRFIGCPAKQGPTTMADPDEFDHFLQAQADIYDTVRQELRAGKKASHWMWFIFPQRAGLGTSTMSVKFAIPSVYAARRYLRHPVLGVRLHECVQLLLQATNHTAEQILGQVDAQKLRSSMTLFSMAADSDESPFDLVLQKYFRGERDELTVAME